MNILIVIKKNQVSMIQKIMILENLNLNVKKINYQCFF